LESYFAYLICRTTLLFFRIVPRIIAHPFLDLLASLVYCVDGYHRRIADINLRIAFPELDSAERRRIARRSFRNTGRNLLEISRMPLLKRETIPLLVEYDPENGLGNYLAAHTRGKGVLYLTGHFSAWELLPAAHCVYGYPLSFVTRPLDNRALEGYLLRMRELPGNRVISKKNAARQTLKALNSGGDVGILMDQNTTLQEGVFADFFGVPAATSTSVARFALHTDAAVVPVFLTPMRNGRYRMKFLPYLDLVRTGNEDHDIEVNTQMFNRALEAIVRENPDSWLWGHKRWKNQPPGSPDPYSLSDEELDRFLARVRRHRD
jgi:KDO2-lipid IV(A) lauroyltransferase